MKMYQVFIIWVIVALQLSSAKNIASTRSSRNNPIRKDKGFTQRILSSSSLFVNNAITKTFPFLRISNLLLQPKKEKKEASTKSATTNKSKKSKSKGNEKSSTTSSDEGEKEESTNSKPVLPSTNLEKRQKRQDFFMQFMSITSTIGSFYGMRLLSKLDIKNDKHHFIIRSSFAIYLLFCNFYYFFIKFLIYQKYKYNQNIPLLPTTTTTSSNNSTTADNIGMDGLLQQFLDKNGDETMNNKLNSNPLFNMFKSSLGNNKNKNPLTTTKQTMNIKEYDSEENLKLFKSLFKDILWVLGCMFFMKNHFKLVYWTIVNGLKARFIQSPLFYLYILRFQSLGSLERPFKSSFEAMMENFKKSLAIKAEVNEEITKLKETVSGETEVPPSSDHSAPTSKDENIAKDDEKVQDNDALKKKGDEKKKQKKENKEKGKKKKIKKPHAEKKEFEKKTESLSNDTSTTVSTDIIKENVEPSLVQPPETPSIPSTSSIGDVTSLSTAPLHDNKEEIEKPVIATPLSAQQSEEKISSTSNETEIETEFIATQPQELPTTKETIKESEGTVKEITPDFEIYEESDVDHPSLPTDFSVSEEISPDEVIDDNDPASDSNIDVNDIIYDESNNFDDFDDANYISDENDDSPIDDTATERLPIDELEEFDDDNNDVIEADENEESEFQEGNESSGELEDSIRALDSLNDVIQTNGKNGVEEEVEEEDAFNGDDYGEGVEDEIEVSNSDEAEELNEDNVDNNNDKGDNDDGNDEDDDRLQAEMEEIESMLNRLNDNKKK